MSTQVSASTYTADTPLAETLDGKLFSRHELVSVFSVFINFPFSSGIQLNDPAYFKTDREWSLMSFLLYRQQCSDFQPSKLAEHDRYARNLTNMINWEGAQVNLMKRASRTFISFQVKYFFFTPSRQM